MSRKAISPDAQAQVLLRSRRRCCVCFGLNRDTAIRQGQIAHLDQNASNNAADNLAFLCFDHHDQYDSSTRQSKNFTVPEVKQFRRELYEAIKLAFSQQVQFGNVSEVVDLIQGHYIRSGKYESAELMLQRLNHGRYHVTGHALWGTHRDYGPNLGDLDFIGELHGDTIEYTWKYPEDGKEYHAWITFKDSGLVVREENWVGIFGMNVNFSGTYDKAT